MKIINVLRTIVPSKLASLLSAIVLANSAPNVLAMTEFFDIVEDVYPNSASLDAGCQFCHQNASGGQSWNAYGWAVRGFFIDSDEVGVEARLREALLLASGSDHDNDNLGLQLGLSAVDTIALDEIAAGVQPGWRSGNNNTIYFLGSTLNNQAAPNFPASTRLDMPPPAGDPIPGNIPQGPIRIGLQSITTGLSTPLQAVRAPGISDSLFVIEQAGKIIRVNTSTGVTTEFYDVGSELVNVGFFGERGLLGLAFSPDYDTSGLFYLHFSGPVEDGVEADFSSLTVTETADHRSVVAEYRATNPLSSNPVVTKVGNFFTIDQPQSNHNGGSLAFDNEGDLYIAIGDGGGADDEGPGHGQEGNGQRTSNPLGSILRITPQGNGSYTVPNTNPFVGSMSEVEEIYAYGLRNPYRFSFDDQTDDLYAADVGQNALEEINIINNGGNYGWKWKEGSFFFFSPFGLGKYISAEAAPSAPNDLVDPIAQYDHQNGGRSVTGGFVYRGSAIPELVGRYVFADFSLRQLYYLDDDNVIRRLIAPTINAGITGFGQDSNNELYITTAGAFTTGNSAGELHKLVPAPLVEGEICVPVTTRDEATILICL